MKAGKDFAALAKANSEDPTSAELWLRRLTSTEAPYDIVRKMRDPALLPSQLNGLEAYAPHVRVVWVDDADHYPMRSHPTLVNQTIREFLRDGDK